MTSDIIHLDDKKIYRLSFHSLEEHMKFIVENEPLKDIWVNISSTKASKKLMIKESSKEEAFTETNSLEEAIELCLNGSKVGYEEFIVFYRELENALPFLSHTRTLIPSFYGHRVNIPKYSRGNPKSAYKIKRQEECKFINLDFNVACSSLTTRSQLFNVGIIVIALIEFLEKFGCRVNLNLFSFTNYKNEYIHITTNIKQFSELRDTSLCYFPFCSVDFVRRIIFATEERVPVENKEWADNYGRPANDKEMTEILGLSENDIRISDPYKMGVFGEDLLEDAKRLFEHINLSSHIGVNESIEYDNDIKKFTLKNNIKY